jgi:hypothetical protein
MALPSNDKIVGDSGHTEDHNAIVDEINIIKNTYLPISSSTTLVSSITSIIVDSAPSTLDTLNELAAALGDDANYAASTASAIGQRLTISNASATYLPISASSDYLRVDTASATYLRQDTASALYLQISASSNYLPVSASINYLRTDNASATYSTKLISTNSQTGTSYVIALSDADKLIEMDNANANTIIIPTNASVAFPVGTKIDFIQTGVGATSASPTSGVTLDSDTNKRTINAQWAAASLIKRDTDTWVLIGALKV